MLWSAWPAATEKQIAYATSTKSGNQPPDNHCTRGLCVLQDSTRLENRFVNASFKTIYQIFSRARVRLQTEKQIAYATSAKSGNQPPDNHCTRGLCVLQDSTTLENRFVNAKRKELPLISSCTIVHK
jgi:hypothetical protein